MESTPFDKKIVDKVIADNYIADFSNSTIRQVCTVAHQVEDVTGDKFIHLEMGVPGLPPAQVGVNAQKVALDRGIASVYPPIASAPELKNETSRFLKAFLNIDVKPEGCFASAGSMQGAFAAFMLCHQIDKKKDSVLFIDPGFSVQKTQLKVLGVNSISFDIYNYRGPKLREKLESYFKEGNIVGILYSNPNNPAWICLTEDELKTIGELCDKYDVIAIEDLAYLAMDFRKDLGKPFKAPYQVTVANYCKNYILMLSGSKIFSYAGERIAAVVISDNLYRKEYPQLKERYSVGEFGWVFANIVLYTLSSGVSHSAQYALAAMYAAASDGSFDFVDDIREYGRRTKAIKKIFLDNGFHIVYDKDGNEDVSDGFYFTIGYEGLTGGELMHELMYYGISTISLSTCGSKQHGLRACSSSVTPDQYEILEKRLKAFARDHKH